MERNLELRWTRRAIEKVAEILEHVSKENAGAGRKLAGEIRSKAEILRAYPFL